MSIRPEAPYGTWASPLSAAAVAATGLRLSAVQLDGEDIYWLEGRPQEGGRYALVRWQRDSSLADLSPPEINVRSRVHEYGGGAFVVRDGVAYCSNFSDQRVYRIKSAAAPEPLTPAAAAGGRGWFYADFEYDRRRNRLICVREDHTLQGREPINTLVAISIGPAKAGHYDDSDDPYVVSGFSRTEVLAAGADFYSTPRLSPDGSKLAWLSWRHPAMPWDGTELWVADIEEGGALVNATRVAGGETESIYQPGWSPEGALYFASDRDGWWKLYRSDPPSLARRSQASFGAAGLSVEPVVRNPPSEAEFGRPQWVFGTATWAFAGPSRLIVSYTRKGRWRLGSVDLASGQLTDIAPGVQPHEWITANPTHAVVVGGFERQADAVVRIDLASGAVETVRAASAIEVDPDCVSVAEAIAFPTSGGETAHAFYYPPNNKAFTAPADEAPPLIVITHGGPTSAARPTFDPYIQYWTTRGFAVADVNYSGSSGYGRAYRQRLNGQWGHVDVEDVIGAARFLIDARRADGRRLIVRGGSAGGYTTLAALTFRPEVFKAGASYYGISDLEALEVDTHKFESRYSHTLIGPYPAAKAVYRARSPIHAIDRLACPLILFQGLEDKVVPPNQSEMMADAVRAKGLPVAYLAFPGEQHGFRRAETIIRCLETELYFYGKVFGFTPADPIDPVVIDNL